MPIRQTFERQPHFTYVVFRDKERRLDHIVTIEAAGDLTFSQEELEVKEESSLLRLVEETGVVDGDGGRKAQSSS